MLSTTAARRCRNQFTCSLSSIILISVSIHSIDCVSFMRQHIPTLCVQSHTLQILNRIRCWILNVKRYTFDCMCISALYVWYDHHIAEFVGCVEKYFLQRKTTTKKRKKKRKKRKPLKIRTKNYKK